MDIIATNREIVDTALSLVGKVKYVFGGNDITNGRGDCSDFTEYVYKCHGYEIGGNTETQYSQGISIPKKDMLPGDLILFKGTYNSGYKDGVSHVGIYLGDSKFVHNSSSKKGTVISSFNSYYDSHFLDARRISGVIYEDGYTVTDQSDISDTVSDNTSNNTSLTFWGDIVRVIVIIIVLLTGAVLLATSAGININKGVAKYVNKV